MRFILASASQVKIDAVSVFFESRVAASLGNLPFGMCGSTPTPQPISLREAFECVEARIAAAVSAVLSFGSNGGDDDNSVVVIAVENFLARLPGGVAGAPPVYADYCLAVLHNIQHHHRGAAVSDVAARFPSVYNEYIHRDEQEPEARGERTTLGERLARDAHIQGCAAVAADDWHLRVSSQGLIDSTSTNAVRLNKHTRAEQIIGALDLAFHSYERRAHYEEHADWPTPGVRFVDVFSPTYEAGGPAQMVKLLSAQVRAHVPAVWSYSEPCAQQARALPMVAGLECRGLVFGFALAVHLGLPFLPVRKPGKLPGAVLRESFRKEYGSDSFEIQDRTFPAGTDVIVVDDVMATGGSAAAACALMERLGLRVTLIVCLKDVPPLRAQWQARLTPRYRVALCQ